MKENFTEKDYNLHFRPCQECYKVLKEELEKIEASGKKTLWYYSGKETLSRFEAKKILIEKGGKEGLSLTPHDVNNIVYILLRKLEK